MEVRGAGQAVYRARRHGGDRLDDHDRGAVLSVH